MRRPTGWAALAVAAAVACDSGGRESAPAAPAPPAAESNDEGAPPRPAPTVTEVQTPPEPSPGGPVSQPRSLEAILLELEEVEGSPANLDDPEADYEARFVRKDELLAEALALGPPVAEAALARLIAARGLPDEVGTRELRPFLARVAAGQDAERARQALGAALRDLEPAELTLLLAAMPPVAASRDAIGGWFVRQSEFARATGGGAVAARVALLEAYVARTPDAAPSDPVLAAAARDPDGAVRARARRP